MSDLDQILSQLPIDQIAAQLGVDPSQVRDAASSAVPALVGGMQANATSGGEQSLLGALQQHADQPMPTSLDQVDTADGSKIVSNIFGDQSDQVVQQLGARTSADGGLIAKVLPMLAPIVMAFLAKKMAGMGQAPRSAPAGGGSTDTPTSGGSGSGPVDLPGDLGGESTATSDPASAPDAAGGGGLGDILGGMLGGGSAGGAGGSSGGLGDILGGMLGGGSAGGSAGGSGGGSGGLGDILGGLLGGGKK